MEEIGQKEEHLKQKEEARTAKTETKELAKFDRGVVMATFDLQSVLQLPCSPVSQFYYKRNLCVYNLTVHVGATKEGHCYVPLVRN